MGSAVVAVGEAESSVPSQGVEAVEGIDTPSPGGVAERGRRGGLLGKIPGIGSDLGLGHNNLVIFWAMLLNEASFGFYQTLTPIYIESLGASPGIVGMVIGISGLTRLIFLAPGGWAADRVPIRKLIVTGRSMTVVGILLYALAPTWWALFPAILVMSAGNIVWPSVSKVIADSTDSRGRTRAFTLIYTVGPSIALLLSPSIGGVMADQISLRSIFFAAAIAQIGSVLFFARLRPVEHTSDEQVTSVGYRTVLRYKPVVVICALFLAMLLVLTTGYTLVPNYLEDEHNVGIGTIGQFGSIFALGSILLGIIIAKVKRFAPPMNALILTTSFAPLAFLLLLFGTSTWVFALAFLFRGGYFVSWGLTYAILGEVSPERLRSRSFALAEVLGGFGFGIAPFIAGALYEIDPTLPLYAALIAVAPLMAGILLARRYVHGLTPATA